MDNEVSAEDKKLYLGMYYRLNKKLKNMELEINALVGCKILPNQMITGMPGAHNNKDLSDLFVLVENEKRKYLKKRYLAAKAMCEISKCINHLQDENEKEVLIHRHILCQDWKKISKEMAYSRSTIFDIYNRALEHIIVPEAKHENYYK